MPRLGSAPDGVRVAGSADRNTIVKLDHELSGVDRARDVDLLLGLGTAYVADDGYLLTVRMGDTRAIGPGVARDPDTIRALVLAAARDAPPGGVSARVPANGAAFDTFLEIGLVADGVGNMMAAGRFPNRSGEHVHPTFPEVL